MQVIMDRRAQGRTTRLLDAASKLQESNDGFTVLFIAPYYQRAHFMADRAMDRIGRWYDGEEGGLDPARTICEHAGDVGMRLRGRLAARDDMMHRTFAFIDDADELGQHDWDYLMDELTVNGIAVSAAVFTSQR